jgi:Flp pilus assembly pilin Flp
MNILASVARRWLSDSEHEVSDGQALVEYSLILVLIIIACLLVVTQTGDVVRDNLWEQTSNLPFW